MSKFSVDSNLTSKNKLNKESAPTVPESITNLIKKLQSQNSNNKITINTSSKKRSFNQSLIRSSSTLDTIHPDAKKQRLISEQNDNKAINIENHNIFDSGLYLRFFATFHNYNIKKSFYLI